MNTATWLRRLFTCVILCLLICNVAYLTKNYLLYITEANVAHCFPVKLNATKLSLCFSISSLLDRSPHEYSFTGHQSIKYINWTFYEVFKRMPSVSNTLDSCKYREFDLDILREEKSGKKCAELFKVTRYRMQGYMCYRFTFPIEQEYSYHRLVNSLYSPRELYHLSIAQPLNDQHILYPLLHLDEFPDDARVFNGETYHESGSLFQLSYDLIESISLPSPYDTRCGRESGFTCYQKCMADVQRRLGYSLDGDMTIENSPASFLRLIPGEMNTESDPSFCYKQCPRYACKQFLVNTRFNKVKNPNEKLLLVVETVNTLITKTLYLPAFPLIDYITQVGAVVSIWTGISVITLSRLIHPRRKVALKIFYLAVRTHLTTVRLLFNRHRGKVREDALSLEKRRLVSKLKRRSILAYLFRVSLLPVLSWQLFNVIHHYFLFQTTTEFEYILDPLVDIPTLGFCFEYKDILDIYGVEPTEANYHQLFLGRDSTLFNMTPKQLLDSNAATDKLIDGCYLRHWKSRFKWFHYRNGSQCLQHFSVEKFFSNNKLCYKMQIRKWREETYQSDIKLLLTNPNIIYAIILSSKVHLPDKLYVFTKFFDTSLSVEFPVRIYTSDMQNNIISLSNQVYVFSMLPAPYDTYCEETWSRAECLEACTSKVLSRYNRISYGGTENRTLDMRFLSYSDLLNGSVNEMWRQTELLCDKKCWRNSCHFVITTTFFEDRFPVNGMRNVLAIDLPSHPKVMMDAYPVMTLYQFMYEILCCFSFWLGVSLIDLKPSSALMKGEMKMKVYLTKVYLVVDKVVDKMLRFGLWSSYVQSVKGLDRRKLLDLCFRYSMMGLCFYHIYYSIMIYLSYSSFIDVYETVETSTDVNLHICLDSAELISRKFPSYIQDPIMARSVIMNRTITSLFADTPREDELIRECGHWGLHSRMTNLSQLGHVSDRIFFSTQNKRICNHVYEVHKFIAQSFMCYSIWPRYYTGWSTLQMKHAFNRQTTILKVAVNSSLLTKRLSLLVNWKKYHSYTSSSFGHNTLHDPNHGHYDVSYIRYVQITPPSPRTKDSFVSFQYDGCLRKCLTERLKMFNLTLSERFREPSNLRFVSYLDRKRNPFKIPFRQIQNKCEKRCLEYNDQVLLEITNKFTIFIPIVRGIRRNWQKRADLTTISLKSTNQPVIKVTFILKVSFFQQIINLGSILGLWFGFSAVTMAKMGRIQDKEVGLEELIAQKQRIRTLRAKYRIRKRVFPGQKVLFAHPNAGRKMPLAHPTHLSV